MKKFHFPACRGSIELNVITKVHKTQEDFFKRIPAFYTQYNYWNICRNFADGVKLGTLHRHCIARRPTSETDRKANGRGRWSKGGRGVTARLPRSALCSCFWGETRRQKQSPPIWGAWRYFCRQQNVILHIARGPQSNPGESTNQDPLSTAFFSRTQTSPKLVSNAWKTRWMLVCLFVCYSIQFEVRVQWVESQQSASEDSGGTWSQNQNPQHIAVHLGRTELPVVFNSKSPKLRLWFDTETFNCRNRKYQFPTMYLTIF